MTALPTDQQLVTRLQSGDLEALGTLYSRHRSLVYRTALSITSNPVDAEDILQDCFLRFHRYAKSVDTSRPLQPWLYWVATHRAYDWKTRGKNRTVPLDEGQNVRSESSPEKHVEVRDLKRRLNGCIQNLTARQREVILLYYHGSQSLKEIAVMMGCPIGTVKSRLYYAREALKQALILGHNVTPDAVGELI